MARIPTKKATFTRKEQGPLGSTNPLHRIAVDDVNDLLDSSVQQAAHIDDIYSLIDNSVIGNTLPIEVELVTSTTPGKISIANGLHTDSDESHMSVFLPVSFGEELNVTMRTDNFNASPPFTGTGVVGYSAPNELAFVEALMGDEIYNSLHGTTNDQHANYVNVPVHITNNAITHIRASSMWKDDNGLSLSIKTLKNQGTASESIGQLYDKVAQLGDTTQTSQPVEPIPVGPDFTFEDKNKLDSLTANPLGFDHGGIIMPPDRTTGKVYRFFFNNDQPAWELVSAAAAVKTLRNLTYRFGAAMDWDKTTEAGYKEAFHDITLITPENAVGPGHIQPGLAVGFDKYVPGANSLTYNYVELDNIADFCVANNSYMHFAHYTWHSAQKAHVEGIITAYPTTYKQVYAQYLDEVASVIFPRIEAKYPGRFVGVNVMNEAVNDSGIDDPQKPCIWKKVFTLDEFFEITFTAVTKYTPPTWKRFYNDYNFETGNMTRTTVVTGLIDRLLAKNIVTSNGRLVKVDGIGDQVHTGIGLVTGSAYTTMKSRFKYWGDKGMLFFISELDTTTADVYDATLAEALANFYTKMMDAYEYGIPPAQRYGFGTWTITDRAYLKSIQAKKNAPDNPVNPITDFPALYDWYGVKKLAYDRVVARGIL